MQYFLVLMLSCAGTPTCPASPHPVFIQMPSLEVCTAVQALNKEASVSIECWAKPTTTNKGNAP